MKTLFWATLTFAAVLGIGLEVFAPMPPATAKAETYVGPAGDFECGRPCVIVESDGGSVISFRIVALQLASNHVPIVVDGPCLSACTILVDMDRDQVCITSNAVFGYHQEYWSENGTTKYKPIKYTTPGLEDYFKSKGGVPADAGDLLLMPFEDASKFYKVCSK